jgi:hypothetical protein
VLILVGIAATLAGPEPAVAPPVVIGWRARLRGSVVLPFLDFMGRRHWLAILAFVALFKLGEALAGVMVTPFYGRRASRATTWLPSAPSSAWRRRWPARWRAAG